jgi:YVTN family beta-propeller protein
MIRRTALSAATVLSLVLVSVSLAGDAPRQKLYVTNSAGNDVTVIELPSHKVIGTIDVGPHPHGIDAPASQNVIYVSGEGKGELVVIDPFTDKVKKTIKIGKLPNQLAVTPDGKFVYVPVDDGHWEVVDPAAGKIVKRIKTGGKPHNTLCSADGKRMYLAPMGDPHKVTIVDVATHEPIGEISFSSVVRPVAMSRDEKRFYAQVDGLVGMEVADIAARKMIHRVAAELNPAQQKVASRSHGIAIRPDQKQIWSCDVEHGLVQVFDRTVEPPKQIATIDMGGKVYWLTFTPDGKICYVSVRSKNEVAAVDTETKKIITRIPAGEVPKRLIVLTLPERPPAAAN